MSKLKVTTIANVADSESTDVTNVINGSAKAWVNFNGTGTVAIRQSFNVSSITDNGTGDYTINFTNAFADTNYAFAGSGAANYANTLTLYIGQDSNDTRSTTQLNIHTIYNNASTAAPDDSPNVNVAVFR